MMVKYVKSQVSKAAFSNYTLRAWEVRTLQRTVKDLLTLHLAGFHRVYGDPKTIWRPVDLAVP